MECWTNNHLAQFNFLWSRLISFVVGFIFIGIKRVSVIHSFPLHSSEASALLKEQFRFKCDINPVKCGNCQRSSIKLVFVKCSNTWPCSLMFRTVNNKSHFTRCWDNWIPFPSVWSTEFNGNRMIPSPSWSVEWSILRCFSTTFFLSVF